MLIIAQTRALYYTNMICLIVPFFSVTKQSRLFSSVRGSEIFFDFNARILFEKKQKKLEMPEPEPDSVSVSSDRSDEPL